MTQHLFVTQDYGPDLGGMARRHVELCRRFPAGTMAVSTVSHPQSRGFDCSEPTPIRREPFSFALAKTLGSQLRWSASLVRQLRGVDVLHLGNIRPCGYAVQVARRRRRAPYVLYVNGGDLLRERHKVRHMLKRWSARDIFGSAAGVVSNSRWTADLARDVMHRIGLRDQPEVAAIDLGTDPRQFTPERDRGALRARLGVGDAPLLVTVARLVPHKGQDVVIRALASLPADVRYLMVGDGHDRPRLEALARERGVADRVLFVGALTDGSLEEAYATASVYVGLSRLEGGVNVEGFGISFVEASACGVPVVAGDSGGVRSAVRDGETGLVIPPEDVDAAVHALRTLLSDDDRRRAMGRAGRTAVETHYNWDRVALETRAFVARVTGTAP